MAIFTLLLPFQPIQQLETSGAPEPPRQARFEPDQYFGKKKKKKKGQEVHFLKALSVCHQCTSAVVICIFDIHVLQNNVAEARDHHEFKHVGHGGSGDHVFSSVTMYHRCTTYHLKLLNYDNIQETNFVFLRRASQVSKFHFVHCCGRRSTFLC